MHTLYEEANTLADTNTLSIIAGSQKNTDGVGSISTNISPVFYTNIVGETSWFEFKFTPDPLLPLPANTGIFLV